MAGDEEFIPHLACIDFNFHMSKTAEERPKFLALLPEETNSQIANFWKFLHYQTIKVTKVEMATLMVEEIQVGYAKAIRLATEAFPISDDASSTQHDMCHSTVSVLMGS
jgi:hypothetical protein